MTPGPPTKPQNRRVRAQRGRGAELREEILDTAEHLLVGCREASDLSIRAITEAIGITPPSLYLHFTSKYALMEAVCGRYVERFEGQCADIVASVDDPLESLLGQIVLYIRTAVEHPAVYRALAMTSPTGAGPSGAEVANQARLLNMAAAHVFAAIGNGDLQGDPVRVGISLWVSAHGLASLLIAKPAFPWPDGEAFVVGFVQTQLRAHAADPAALDARWAISRPKARRRRTS